MNSQILLYLIICTLTWGAFLVAFRSYFRHRLTFHGQRQVLIAALFSGILIPLIPSPAALGSVASITLPLVDFSGAETLSISLHSNEQYLPSTLLIIWLSGALIFAWRRWRGWLNLRHLIQSSETRMMQGERIVLIDGLAGPFHFAGRHFFPADMDLSSPTFRMALDHERAHRQLGHHLDLVLLEVLALGFWFHPLFYLLRRDLRLSHELAADAIVLRENDRDTYARLIGGLQPLQTLAYPGHALQQGPLKTRLMSLYQSHHRRGNRPLLLVLPLLMTLVWLTACVKQAPSDPALSQIESTTPTDEQIFTVVDDMPRFPGCEELNVSKEELEACAQQRLFGYIFDHLTYPEEAKKAEAEGTVVVSFNVRSNGSVEFVEIVKDPGFGMANVVEELIRDMNQNEVVWRPGYQHGEAVTVNLKLPVRFKLS